MIKLPDELLKLIFHCLCAQDLLNVEIVCSSWRNACRASDKDLWNPLIDQIWSSFTVNRPGGNNIFVRIQKLPIIRLKKSLIGVDITRCVERSDFETTLLAKLVFHRKMKRELNGEDRRFRGRYLTMYFPDWSLLMGAYKASFFYAKVEMSRNSITQAELCMIPWIFRFKGYYQEEMAINSQFFMNGTFRSNMHAHELHYEFSNREDGSIRIQVEQYPPLSSYRLQNGAWQLENENVIFSHVMNEAWNGDTIPLV